MREKIIEIILEAVRESNELLKDKVPLEQGEKSPLFGPEGVLDSISLVALVVNVEQQIEDEFNASIILANEKAMSRRSSPFLSVGVLADYCQELILEEGKA